MSNEFLLRENRVAARTRRRKLKNTYRLMVHWKARGTIHLDFTEKHVRLCQELTEIYFDVDPLNVKGYADLGFPNSCVENEYSSEAAIIVSRLSDDSETYESVVWKVWDVFVTRLCEEYPSRYTLMARRTFNALRIWTGNPPVTFPDDLCLDRAKGNIPIYLD